MCSTTIKVMLLGNTFILDDSFILDDDDASGGVIAYQVLQRPVRLTVPGTCQDALPSTFIYHPLSIGLIHMKATFLQHLKYI